MTSFGSSFSANKQQVKKPIHQELDKAPRQFNDYMNSINGRFSEICRIYLDGLSVDDVKYLHPDDLIAIVPESQHNHKLLMTIMVRRYLYRPDEKCCQYTDSQYTDCQYTDCQYIDCQAANSRTIICTPNKGDTYENDNSSVCSVNSGYDTDSSVKSKTRKNDNIYACNKCTHMCKNPKCAHSCDDYVKIVQKTS